MAAAPVPRTPIITLRFGGGAPPPEGPVLEPTPDQQFELAEQKRQNEVQQRAAAKPEGGGGFGKFLGSVGSAIANTASDAQAGTEAAIRNAHINKNKERFAKNFPQLVGAGEQLITDYECKVLHQGQKVAGHLALSTNYLTFQSTNLVEIIPLREIACIRRSVSLATIGGGPPFVMLAPAPNVVSDCLQVFTIKQQLFQFLDFSSILVSAGNATGSAGVNGACFERVFNFLDHAWRAATPVPVPGAQYAA